jgi:hypothetical protein
VLSTTRMLGRCAPNGPHCESSCIEPADWLQPYVPIDFQFVATAGKPKIEGTAKLKRLEFGVGHGDWKSTAEVKDEVKAAFSRVLKPAP